MKVTDHSVKSFEQNVQINQHIIQQVRDGLNAFNQAAHPDPDEAPLTLSIQAQDGKVLAGLLGSNVYRWLRVDYVWVDEQHRHKGLGTALLNKAEEIAISRGCLGVQLDTYTYQAPRFYERLGYKAFGELENYPDDNKRIYFRKDLTSER